MSGQIRQHIGLEKRRLLKAQQDAFGLLREYDYGSMDDDALLDLHGDLDDARKRLLKHYSKMETSHNEWMVLIRENNEEETILINYVQQNGDFRKDMSKAAAILVQLDEMLDVTDKLLKARGIPSDLVSEGSTISEKVFVEKDMPVSDVMNQEMEDDDSPKSVFLRSTQRDVTFLRGPGETGIMMPVGQHEYGYGHPAVGLHQEIPATGRAIGHLPAPPPVMHRSMPPTMSQQPSAPPPTSSHPVTWNATINNHLQRNAVAPKMSHTAPYAPMINNNLQGNATQMTSGITIFDASLLSRLELPQFSGFIMDFPEFWERYYALVHSKTTIDAASKFSLLKSCLKGDALQTVSCLPVTSYNYDTAVQMLYSKYYNIAAIRHALYSQLASLPSVETEGEPLYNLYLKMQKLVSQYSYLQNSGIETEYGLGAVLMNKLPRSTKEKIYDKTLGMQNLSPVELLSLLQEIVQKAFILNTMDPEYSVDRSNTFSVQVQGSRNYGGHARGGQQHHQRGPKEDFGWGAMIAEESRGGRQQNSHPTNTARPGNGNGPHAACVFCDQHHHVWKCQLDVAARISAVKKKNLCYLCFKTDHRSSECRRKSCPCCDGRHSSLLCFRKAKQQQGGQTRSQEPGQRANGGTYGQQQGLYSRGDHQGEYRYTAGGRTYFVQEAGKTDGHPGEDDGVVCDEDGVNCDEEGFTHVAHSLQGQVTAECERNDEKDCPVETVNHVTKDQIAMMCAELIVCNPKDPSKKQKLLAFFDNGSDRSYILKDAAEQLELDALEEKNLLLNTFAQLSPVVHSTKLHDVHLMLKDNSTFRLQVKSLPMLTQELTCVPVMEDDGVDSVIGPPTAIVKRTPALLIGNDYFWKIVLGDNFYSRQLPGGGFMLNTRLRPVLTGRMSQLSTDQESLDTQMTLSEDSHDYLNELPQKFFAPETNEANEMYLFSDAKMHLKEWNSSSNEVNRYITEKENGQPDEEQFVLGLKWNAMEDTLMIVVPQFEEKIWTKHPVLKAVASIFDPNGFLSAVVELKIFLQSRWKLELTWDMSLPHELKELWRMMLFGWTSIEYFSFPRLMSCSKEMITLHIFADDPKDAYGICAYFEGKEKPVLLCSKTRWSTMQTKMTIPQLELMAMDATMSVFIVKEFNLPLSRTINWYSELSLIWMQCKKTLPVFINNRLNAMLRHAVRKKAPHAILRHIRSEHNPADIASQGLPAKDLMEMDICWNGPEMLQLPEDKWPSDLSGVEETKLERTVNTPDAAFEEIEITHKDDNVFEHLYVSVSDERRFSNWSRVCRCYGTLVECNLSYDANYPIYLPMRAKITREEATSAVGCSLSGKEVHGHLIYISDVPAIQSHQTSRILSTVDEMGITEWESSQGSVRVQQLGFASIFCFPPVSRRIAVNHPLHFSSFSHSLRYPLL